jgi:hypothetical protein
MKLFIENKTNFRDFSNEVDLLILMGWDIIKYRTVKEYTSFSATLIKESHKLSLAEDYPTSDGAKARYKRQKARELEWKEIIDNK